MVRHPEMEQRTAVQRDIDRHHYDQLPRHDLIVCASLVQNPTNLGGLCRSCEAFRIAALVMADPSIAQSFPFRNVAASTHRWQPLLTCPPAHLVNWLKQQQQAGYCLVAFHAHTDATPLTEFAFPRRSILVLGQELTGIPNEILSLCDQCITIAQFGLVESLNVQTAGAIGMYEYVRQHPIAP